MRTLGEFYGVNLAKLDGKRVEEPIADCPGALVCVTSADIEAMRNGGEMIASVKFGQGMKYGSARVYCKRPVEVGPLGVGGYPVVYGLCSSCSSVERDNRATLTERQQRGAATK